MLLVVGIGAPYMLVVAQGLKRASVEQFAIVTPASMIVFSTLASTFLLRARLVWTEAIGIALIVAGVLLAGIHEFLAVHSAASTYAIFVAGGLLWAIYTVCAKRFAVTALHETAIVSVFSMAAYLPFYLIFRGVHFLRATPTDIGLQAVYQGVLVSVIALFFYSNSDEGASVQDHSDAGRRSGRHALCSLHRITRLTQAGATLLEHVPRIFAALEQARASVREAAAG